MTSSALTANPLCRFLSLALLWLAFKCVCTCQSSCWRPIFCWIHQTTDSFFSNAVFFIIHHSMWPVNLLFCLSSSLHNLDHLWFSLSQAAGGTKTCRSCSWEETRFISNWLLPPQWQRERDIQEIDFREKERERPNKTCLTFPEDFSPL